jgi:hypothetical protein
MKPSIPSKLSNFFSLKQIHSEAIVSLCYNIVLRRDPTNAELRSGYNADNNTGLQDLLLQLRQQTRLDQQLASKSACQNNLFSKGKVTLLTAVSVNNPEIARIYKMLISL